MPCATHIVTVTGCSLCEAGASTAPTQGQGHTWLEINRDGTLYNFMCERCNMGATSDSPNISSWMFGLCSGQVNCLIANPEIPDVKVGHCWTSITVGDCLVVRSNNDSRAGSDSWVMQSVRDQTTYYMHHKPRMAGEWSLVKPAPPPPKPAWLRLHLEDDPFT